MAPSTRKDESARMQNKALLEVVLYTNQNRGSWGTKKDQDTALAYIIKERRLQRYLANNTTVKTPHDVKTLRSLLSTKIRLHQKASAAGAAKKTIEDFFVLGSSLFTEDFLDEIEYDEIEREDIIHDDLDGSTTPRSPAVGQPQAANGPSAARTMRRNEVPGPSNPK